MSSIHLYVHVPFFLALILYLLYFYSLSTVPTEAISNSLQDEISVLLAKKCTTRSDMSDWLARLSDFSPAHIVWYLCQIN